MYTHRNFRTKKELKTAIANGETVTVYQPGPFGEPSERTHSSIVYNGTAYVEGPHYPEPHRWYATVTLENGVIKTVK